jgi:hypothetical protein
MNKKSPFRVLGTLPVATVLILSLALVACGGVDTTPTNHSLSQDGGSGGGGSGGGSGSGGGGSSPSPDPTPVPGPSPAPATTSVTVSWAPNSDLGVAGYIVYFGASPDLLTNPVVVGVSSQPSATINVPVSGTSYIAVQAYNSAGQFSVLSNAVTIN